MVRFRNETVTGSLRFRYRYVEALILRAFEPFIRNKKRTLTQKSRNHTFELRAFKFKFFFGNANGKLWEKKNHRHLQRNRSSEIRSENRFLRSDGNRIPAPKNLLSTFNREVCAKKSDVSFFIWQTEIRRTLYRERARLQDRTYRRRRSRTSSSLFRMPRAYGFFCLPYYAYRSI